MWGLGPYYSYNSITRVGLTEKKIIARRIKEQVLQITEMNVAGRGKSEFLWVIAFLGSSEVVSVNEAS